MKTLGFILGKIRRHLSRLYSHIFNFKATCVRTKSILVIIDARAPVAKEKEITPMSIRIVHKTFSSIEYAVMSP